MVVAVVLAGACTTPADPVATTTSVPLASSTVPAAPTTADMGPATTVAASSSLAFAEPGDAGARVLFSVPVGDDGVVYEGGFEDWEVDGPQALTVSEDGSIWVADTGGRRLLRYSRAGQLLLEVDTDAHDVAGLVDLAAVGDGVWGLEIVPAFDRNRIVLFDEAGALVAEHELPAGLHLQDGLSGIATTPDDRLWVELEGGSRVYSVVDAAGAFAVEPSDGYEIGGVSVGPLPSTGGDPVARFAVGEAVVERVVREQGGITFEGATPRWIALLLSDVAFDTDGSLSVLTEVLLTDLAGEVVGTATYPLGDVATGAYVPNEFIAVGPEGRLFALRPAADRIDVVELAIFPVDDGG